MKTCSICGGSKSEGEFYLMAGRLAAACKKCACLAAQKEYQKNRKSAIRRSRSWVLSNRERRRKTVLRWYKEKYASDPKFHVVACLRSRLSSAISQAKAKKATCTMDLLGCPWVWLEVHLESLFKPGMTWKNHGPVWHIDHVKPCAGYDLLDPEQQKACFHWTNLQPLFVEENLKKGAK